MGTTIQNYNYWKGTPRRLAKTAGFDGPFLDHDNFYNAPYGMVYTHQLGKEWDFDKPTGILESAYVRHNADNRPLGRFVGAMTSGDLIELQLVRQEGHNFDVTSVLYLCQPFGFEEISADVVDAGSDYIVDNDGDAHEFILTRRRLLKQGGHF